jgi:mycothiol synthase
VSIVARGRIEAPEAEAILSLANAAAAADGVAPLSEQVRLHLRYGGDPAAGNLLLWQGRELAGFAHLDPPDPAEGRSGELVVHPAHRRQGLGRELATAAVTEGGALPIRIWAHGDLPAAAGLAKATRFTRSRALWRMVRSLRDQPLPPPSLPDGVSLRTFIPGHDEAEWLAVNARAFADHPEQGRWTPADLEHRQHEPWFDPAGFFLADREDRMVGFHWTKIHSSGAAMGAAGATGGTDEPSAAMVSGVTVADGASVAGGVGAVGASGPGRPGTAGREAGGTSGTGSESGATSSQSGATSSQSGASGSQSGTGSGNVPIGEVYVLGVDPSEQGTGLGRALSLAGLHYLAERGLPAVMLYVEESNVAAIHLYESLGFAHVSTDVMYAHAPG